MQERDLSQNVYIISGRVISRAVAGDVINLKFVNFFALSKAKFKMSEHNEIRHYFGSSSVLN